MVRGERDSAVDWERRSDLLFQAIPYVLMPLATVLMLITSRTPWTEQRATVGIALAGLLWTGINYTRPAGFWARQPIRPFVYFLGVIGFAYVLMSREPIYFIYTITGFIHAFLLTPAIFSFVGIAATSVIINTVPSGGLPRTATEWATGLTLVCVQTLAIGSFAFMGNKMSEQSQARQRMVLELEQAMAENANLQQQLVAQARDAGALDERQRMAREIHDTLAQSLIGIITQLEAAEESSADGRTHDRHVTNATRLARDALAEARRSVHALGPQSLENRALPDALDDVVTAWSDLHAVPAEVMITGKIEPLHPEVEGTLIRTAQEALANVAKHARATRVGLTLSYMGDVVSLDVRDDGVGFEPSTGPAGQDGNGNECGGQDGGGFGLTAMGQRISRLAGTLVIESETGRGTAISACVPAVPLASIDG